MQSDPDRPGLACEVNDHQCVLRAWLPGISPEQVRVALHGDRLTIWSTAPESDTPSDDFFCHSVRLPNPVNLARASMHYQDGELTVTLPHTRGRIRLPGEAPVTRTTSTSSHAHARTSPTRRAAAVLVS